MSNYYDENELIRRIQKGDESALAIIISEYHAYVGKIVYSILGSYSHKIDLQGVVNQIFFTLWHKANKIDPSKSVTIKGYFMWRPLPKRWKQCPTTRASWRNGC